MVTSTYVENVGTFCVFGIIVSSSRGKNEEENKSERVCKIVPMDIELFQTLLITYLNLRRGRGNNNMGRIDDSKAYGLHD